MRSEHVDRHCNVSRRPHLRACRFSRRIHGRCRTKERSVPGRHAPARQPVPRTRCPNRTACAAIFGRTDHRRPQARCSRSIMRWCASSRPRTSRSISTRRPFVVVDPRAGHGPGIGGFKADSEIGVAMKAGHPCYFIGFLPEPMPGQTIEDIARAEAVFIEKVIALHPQADGKPCVIGNCQAGWAVMMLAVAAAGAVRARSSSPARRCPIGRACAANTRCATPAACWAAAG